MKRKHKEVTISLANLNRELALELLVKANHTGGIEHLIEAVHALNKSHEYYRLETTQIETAEIQKKIGDLLLSVGKSEQNMRALDYAIIAYKSAITISSLLDVQPLRNEARTNYGLARNYRGLEVRKPGFSLMGAA
ncbi:MAG: hypothetical protein V3U57_04215 [Robiginitomaculum sp.]